jgi:hypothetical protein
MSNDEFEKKKFKWNIKEKNQSQLGLTWLTHCTQYEIGIKRLIFLKKRGHKKNQSFK